MARGTWQCLAGGGEQSQGTPHRRLQPRYGPAPIMRLSATTGGAPCDSGSPCMRPGQERPMEQRMETGSYSMLCNLFGGALVEALAHFLHVIEHERRGETYCGASDN